MKPSSLVGIFATVSTHLFCSCSSPSGAANPPGTSDDSGPVDAPTTPPNTSDSMVAAEDADVATADARQDTRDLCPAAPRASGCSSDASWVRGIARFNSAHFAAGAKPTLRVALRHSFTLIEGEELIGGRLHMSANVSVADVSSGAVPFAIDMCGMGASAWSEENGIHHLVLSIDENKNNDLDSAMSNDDAIRIAKPDVGELTRLVKVALSCFGASPCVEVHLDCTDGVKCTTISPVVTCTSKSPDCASDEKFCR